MLQDATIHVYLPASNLARARAFYERVLGLTPKEEYAGGVFYECGGGVAFLYPLQTRARPGRARLSGRSRTWRRRSPI